MTGPETVAAFRTMVTIREFENHAAQLRNRGVIVCSLHLANGQEAIAVGAHAALGSSDTVNATYRGHHWAIACGIPLEALFGEFMGRATGVNGGRGGAGFFADPDHRFLGENGIVGAGAAIGAGAALAARYDGSGRVALTAFGDGALNQGAVHEAMSFAAILSLPVVFVCENNGYAEYTPTESMFPAGPLESRAAIYGFPGVAVDGGDLARRPRDGVRGGGTCARGRRPDAGRRHRPPARRPPHARRRAVPPGGREGAVGRASRIPSPGCALPSSARGSRTRTSWRGSRATRGRTCARRRTRRRRQPASDPAQLEQHVYG